MTVERRFVEGGIEWIPRQAIPAVVLDGSGAGNTAGLVLEAGGCVIRGLAVRRFERAGIEVSGPGGNRIEGSSIEENGGAGVLVLSGMHSTILGSSIAANRGPGIDLAAFSLSRVRR